MTNPIKEIIRYLRDLDPFDDFNRRIVEEKRQLRSYRRIQERLLHLVRELESIVSRLRELTD